MQMRSSPLFQVTLVIAVIATLTIAAAWAFQLFGGYMPCPLCLTQRWPYYVVVPLAFLLLWQAKISPRLTRAGLLLIGLIMLAGAAVATYHAGVEWKWWPGPQSCAASGGLSGGLPDLTNARVVRCDEAPWRFLGLSFAGWNLVISLILAGLALGALRWRADQGSSSVSQ
jgi:disulfide bond formation protein DsbB